MIRGLTIRVGRTGADFFGGSGLFLKRAGIGFAVCRFGGFVGWLVEATET